ncbi:MAG: type II secretion system F family protein [Lachnospiraceae bacterium]|nr:type II secretion system F family protein [Lachnospiraceae bacterium]
MFGKEKKERKKPKEKKYLHIGKLRVQRDTVLILSLVELLGIGLAISDYRSGELHFNGELARPAYDERDMETELVVADSRDEKNNVRVHVSRQAFTGEEALARMEEAKKEIDSSIAGDNPSLESITKPLAVAGEYSEGAVEASWSFSEPSLIGQDGSVHLENVTEDTVCYASATLSCGTYETVYSFPVRVVVPNVKSEEGFSYYLKKALYDADEATKEAAVLVLPTTVNGTKVTWKRKRNYRGQELALMGIIAGVAVVLGQGEEARRARARRSEALEADYPQLVSTLSLYVSAGISVKGAFERIAAQYKSRMPDKRGSPHPGYDAIVIALREMEDGLSETQAYRKFGQRCDHRYYSKLAMMLSQNVKKGNRQLKEQLEKEEAECFEARKVRARILGEEASTKLLIPMGMMLGVVLIVTIAPALMNMSL